NLLGRVIALALILGAVYGVREISRGGLGCSLGEGGSCTFVMPHEDSSPAVKAAPAKSDDLSNPDAPKNIPAPAPEKIAD
ncbi:MAG: hypothetical protein KGJ84_10040, partial [Elusimicrobia bacterium]|nr:hypothetical protein [Elusimicrobiota bacterium]